MKVVKTKEEEKGKKKMPQLIKGLEKKKEVSFITKVWRKKNAYDFHRKAVRHIVKYVVYTPVYRSMHHI